MTKKKSIKYSFILPIYKVELYLEECIESILKQTIIDFEIILVDDGSPDKCPEICDKYKKIDSRIKVVHKPNGGLSDARNAGMKQAIGRYLLFVDPDDYLEEDYLDVIDRSIDSEYDLLIFSYYDLYKNKRIKGYGKDEILTRDEALVYLVSDGKYCGYAWNKVYSKSIIDKYGLMFDRNVVMCEDVLFAYQYISKINSIKTISSAIINYRQRKNSLVSEKIKNINSTPLFKTYQYIINDTKNTEVKNKSKALYLKYYYKYKKYAEQDVIDNNLIKNIEKYDYAAFSERDKKLIKMFKYVPFIRPMLFGLKDLINRRFD